MGGTRALWILMAPTHLAVCSQDSDWQSPRQLVCRDSSIHVPRCHVSHSLLSHLQCDIHVCPCTEITSELEGMVQRPFLPLQMQKLSAAEVKGLAKAR